MTDEHQQPETEPVATSSDASRHVATSDDEYVSLREAREMFLVRGRPIVERSLQRACKAHNLQCKKITTVDGEKWFALKSSVLNRIAELQEFDRLRDQRRDATRPGAPGRVAPDAPLEPSLDSERPGTTDDMSAPVVTAEESHATPSDQARPVAARRDTSDEGAVARERELYDRLLETYEQQIDGLVQDKTHLQIDKEALLRQLEAKDRQIDRFFEGEHDTKSLLGGLQTLMNAIWPGSASKGNGERFAPMREALDTGLERDSEKREKPNM